MDVAQIDRLGVTGHIGQPRRRRARLRSGWPPAGVHHGDEDLGARARVARDRGVRRRSTVELLRLGGWADLPARRDEQDVIRGCDADAQPLVDKVEDLLERDVVAPGGHLEDCQTTLVLESTPCRQRFASTPFHPLGVHLAGIEDLGHLTPALVPGKDVARAVEVVQTTVLEPHRRRELGPTHRLDQVADLLAQDRLVQLGLVALIALGLGARRVGWRIVHDGPPDGLGWSVTGDAGRAWPCLRLAI